MDPDYNHLNSIITKAVQTFIIQTKDFCKNNGFHTSRMYFLYIFLFIEEVFEQYYILT